MNAKLKLLTLGTVALSFNLIAADSNTCRGIGGNYCQQVSDQAKPQQPAAEQDFSNDDKQSPKQPTQQDVRKNIDANLALNMRIQKMLKTEFSSSKITVEVNQGSVFLRGTVANANERLRIFNAVEKIDGVREVNNQLRVSGN